MRVPTPAHRRVYVAATRPHLQAIEHRLEKNRNVALLIFALSCPRLRGVTIGSWNCIDQIPRTAHSSMSASYPSTRPRSSPQASGFQISM